ncbi:uncharacterized protein [Triticum aestivum]|uniref:uncharacterized protein n=1 Tax=Triticum aestivum TaxID=4565 RepID=UPI001D0045C0|nr:uncharacterized protein LOC123139045 [Triticum aestivum]
MHDPSARLFELCAYAALCIFVIAFDNDSLANSHVQSLSAISSKLDKRNNFHAKLTFLRTSPSQLVQLPLKTFRSGHKFLMDSVPVHRLLQKPTRERALLSLPRLPIPAARSPTPRGGRSGAAPANRPAIRRSSRPGWWPGAPAASADQEEEEERAWADREEEEDAGRGKPGGGGGRGEGEDAGLGAVPVVVAVLAEPGASPTTLVHAAAAAGSFACGIEDGAWAVLAVGAMGHLTRLPAHPHDKSIHWPQPDPQERGARDGGHPD